MKALNLSNQKFGHLTVIEKAPKQNDKYTRWICQCDCGVITTVRTDYLRNGHTTSCGCISHKVSHIGERFGKLIAIKQFGNKYLCQCDCGNTTLVLTYNLTSGNTQSCGCYQKERMTETLFISLVGQKFGKLKVIERVANDRFNHVNYKCKCDCGGITIVDAGRLRDGTVNSCGCIKSKGEMLINKWLQEHNIKFVSQYSHDKIILDSGHRPFFDFAIMNDDGTVKYFIEYNGKQHYQVTGGWNTPEHFEQLKHRDIQKEKLCKELHIPLYKIRYDDNLFKCLEGIIKDTADAPDMEEAQEVQ